MTGRLLFAYQTQGAGISMIGTHLMENIRSHFKWDTLLIKISFNSKSSRTLNLEHNFKKRQIEEMLERRSKWNTNRDRIQGLLITFVDVISGCKIEKVDQLYLEFQLTEFKRIAMLTWIYDKFSRNYRRKTNEKLWSNPIRGLYVYKFTKADSVLHMWNRESLFL